MTETGSAGIAEARGATYRLLARLALAEVDRALAEELRGLPLFAAAMAAGGDADGLRRLRVEFTRLFLMNVHPYESVYLDETGMLNTPRSGAVLGHYRENGFEPAEAATVGAPDHLGLELRFMAHLAGREAAAERAMNRALAKALREAQAHFLESHLTRWAPLFGAALVDTAAGPLYRTLGEMLESFVLGDYERLARPG